MAIKRQKLDRNANLTLDSGRVIDMPPGWIFTIDCPHHGKIEFDFDHLRKYGRDDLVGQMRDAIWSLRHELSGKTLYSYEFHLRYFWRFLDELHTAGAPITNLDQIDRTLVDRYLAWLELQIVTTGRTKGQALSLGAKKSAFAVLKALLTNRQKRTPVAVNPELGFPRNPFPNAGRLIPKRKPYSKAEQERILDALNKDLRSIHEGEGIPLKYQQVLSVHLLVLGLTTGRNLQPLLELRRDSLQKHPLPERELLVTTKRRGWSSHATSLRKVAAHPKDQRSLLTIPATIGDHFRFLCAFTAPLVDDAIESDRKFAFLYRLSPKKRNGKVVRVSDQIAKSAVMAFTRRHDLRDDQGQRLMLNMARLRPTYATELYRRTGDIRCVQQALGHASAGTTARHYAEVPPEAERDHAIVLDAMVSQYTRMEINGKVLLAADGQLPQNVQNLLSGGYNTGIARCRNPFRDNETVCKKFFACFRCQNMVIFEDDLWRLFSFYYRLLSERAKLSPPQWLKTYGPIIKRIDMDIASQFSADTVEAARFRAQKDPHPAWKGPLP